MITWDDSQTQCQNLSSDNSSTSLTFFKFMMNVGYKLILADLGRPATEKTSSGLVTTASQNYVDLPMDCLFPKSVTVTYGGKNYPVYEEESQEGWDELNTYSQTSDPPDKYFVRLNFGVGHSQLLFYPTPSTGSLPVNVVYEVIDKNLENDVYSTGTLTMTNGDKTVTIATGAFTAAMVGRYIKGGDGFYYKIASRTDANNVELEHAYEGTTSASITTSIQEMFHLPEEMQILPVYFALAHYFAVKKDTTQETKYWTLYNAGLEAGRKRWATKARSSLVRSGGMRSRWQPWAPPFFPNSAS